MLTPGEYAARVEGYDPPAAPPAHAHPGSFHLVENLRRRRVVVRGGLSQKRGSPPSSAEAFAEIRAHRANPSTPPCSVRVKPPAFER